MRKIPTLFAREFADHRVVAIKDEITPGCEDAFYHGEATIKIEGLVFWLNGEPVCKIKRSNFGLPWPIKECDSNA